MCGRRRRVAARRRCPARTMSTPWCVRGSCCVLRVVLLPPVRAPAVMVADLPPLPWPTLVVVVSLQAPRSERNFVAHNRREATEVAVAKESAGEAEAELHEHFGQVPDYLLKRQEKWNVAEEKRIAQLPDKDCPPGMSLMPDEERQETLNVLLKSQGVAKDQLRRMPLVVETQGQVRRKNELDAKLKEIEEAIVIFSREKVFVKD